MALHGFVGLFNGDVPGAHSVEAACDGGGLADLLGELDSAPVVFARALVVAPRPEHAEIEQGAELRLPVADVAGDLKGGLLVGAGSGELAEGFVHEAAQAVQAGIGHHVEALACLEGAGKLFYGDAGLVLGAQSYARTLGVGEGALPCSGLEEVVGEVGEVLVELVGAIALYGVADAAV